MAALRGDEDDLWPTQIADFLLGRISADTLLALAAKQQAEPQIRACEAKLYMAQWHSSRGEEGPAAALSDPAAGACGSELAAPLTPARPGA
jgi:lipoprotein NlpI